MNAPRIQQLTRWATWAMSRRHSLFALGGAAASLGALLPATPEEVSAGQQKKRRRRIRKRARQQVKKTCRGQFDECRQIVEGHCARTNVPDACTARFLECCEPLASCNSRESTACLLSFNG